MKITILTFFCLILLLTSSFAIVLPRLSSADTSTVLRMTLVVPPTSINPNTLTTGTSGGILIGMEYYGSPVAAPDGSLANSIAVTDWISHNANYTQWIFNVKPGLKWSDGTNVTSADILATFGPNFGFNSTYDYLGMHTEVKNETALNSSAALYELNTPDAHWPDKFNWDLYSPVYPAEFIQKYGAAGSNLGTNVVVGPFYTSNYQPGQTQMVLLRNPYFQPQPKISEIDVNFVETLSLTAGSLLSGSTDLAPIEPSNAPAILKNPNLHILDEKGLYVSSLQYNDTLYPYNMTQFRQALAFGINQSAFVSEALNGYGLTGYSAEGVVSPSASLWYNSNEMKYSFNQSEALALLSQVGINKSTDGLLHYPNGTAVSLTLWTDTDNTEDSIGVTSIQKDLQHLGFTVSVQTTSISSIVGEYSGNLDSIRSGIILATSNPPVWGNPYLDSLPAWDVYWLATTPNVHWEYPPSADNDYQGNYSAFLATANQTQEQQDLNNIQALNAQYLPTIVLAYPDALWAYNSQAWTNWPTGYIEFGAQIMNNTAFVNLQPTSPGSSSTTNSSSSSSSSAPPSTSVNSTPSPSTVSTTSSTTSTSSGNNPVLYVGLAVVVIIIVAGVAVFTMRRKPKPA